MRVLTPIAHLDCNKRIADAVASMALSCSAASLDSPTASTALLGARRAARFVVPRVLLIALCRCRLACVMANAKQSLYRTSLAGHPLLTSWTLVASTSQRIDCYVGFRSCRTSHIRCSSLVFPTTSVALTSSQRVVSDRIVNGPWLQALRNTTIVTTATDSIASRRVRC